MLNLKSFHLLVAFLGIVIAAGVGTWAVLHQHAVGGTIALAIGVLLIVYVGYFAGKAQSIPE